MKGMLSSELLARLQQLQDILADRSRLCLVLMDSKGEELTIPSRLPLICISEGHQLSCASEIRLLIKKCRKQDAPVIEQCPHGYYIFGLRTSIATPEEEAYLIGGRTDDLKRIQDELPLISAIYKLPLNIAPSAEETKKKQSEDGTPVPEALRLLTPQEIKILYMLGSGFSNKMIASKLYISPNTVKVHVSRILQKLNLSNRTDAALFAVESGLVKRDQIVDQ
ncbi:MAG: LuxR C-terminal-related transcriptional regulator [Thermacetogeniaceae bacterium]